METSSSETAAPRSGFARGILHRIRNSAKNGPRFASGSESLPTKDRRKELLRLLASALIAARTTAVVRRILVARADLAAVLLLLTLIHLTLALLLRLLVFTHSKVSVDTTSGVCSTGGV